MKPIWTWVIIGCLFSATALADDLHLKSFDTVWRTVYRSHYDPTFGGLDWPGLRDSYRPRIVSARDILGFIRITNQMLFELKISHLLVGTKPHLQSYLPTVMAPGGIGVTVRLIDGQCVIASVEPGSPANRAGLHPGAAVLAIDRRPVPELIEAACRQLTPPYNPRNRENTITRYILGQIQGLPDTFVHLAWEEKNAQLRDSAIPRTSTGPGVRLVDFLPSYHLQLEYRQLNPNIGYVRFNHFAPPVDRPLAKILEALPADTGLIIDLRGTPGGYLRSLDTVAGMLIEEPVVLYRLQLRDKIIDRVPVPAAQVFRGPVAIIIDALSLSASELLAGCLQQLDRAVIVGTRSPGYMLTADWAELPNGAFFMYTIGRNFTPAGTILEDAGVTPDIEVALDRQALTEGRDTQIEAAAKAVKAALGKTGF